MHLVVFGISHDLVRFDDLGLAGFEEWLLDFVEDILMHDVVIQLGVSFTVETEPPHFAFYVTIVGLVPIVLGAARHEFPDVVVLVQFTRKVAEVIAQVWVVLSLACIIDDRVGVVVEDTLLQLLQGGIESESGPTGSETGYKDVKVG